MCVCVYLFVFHFRHILFSLLGTEPRKHKTAFLYFSSFYYCYYYIVLRQLSLSCPGWTWMWASSAFTSWVAERIGIYPTIPDWIWIFKNSFHLYSLWLCFFFTLHACSKFVTTAFTSLSARSSIFGISGNVSIDWFISFVIVYGIFYFFAWLIIFLNIGHYELHTLVSGYCII